MDQMRKQRLIRTVERAASAAFKNADQLESYLNPGVVRDYDPEDYSDYGDYDQDVIRVSVEDYRDLCAIFTGGTIQQPVFLRMAARHLIATLRSQLRVGSKKATGVLSRVA